MSVYHSTPLEQMLGIAVGKRQVTIGVPSPNGNDKRFPLTPEGAGMLVERGFAIKIEENAPSKIHYDDFRYQKHGVDIVDRAETLRCDIVISLAPLTSIDARMLKRGAMLLTLYNSSVENAQVAAILLKNRIIVLALDLVEDDRGHRPFSDILSEISGRASIVIASSLLADSNHGKGILLGGVAGIVPCEVTIIGSGIDACSAARSALGLGAIVRMFDNDVYRLRAAMRELGPGVSGSAIHPKVLLSALRSADVVIATTIKPLHVLSAEIASEMKKGVVAFDLGNSLYPVFPSLLQVDLGMLAPSEFAETVQRVCYVNPGNAVPRTVAMALSNALLTMMADMFTSEGGFNNAILLNTSLQRAALCFMGKPTHPGFAALVGIRQVDIKLLLQFS